jgi:hypothetical protein
MLYVLRTGVSWQDVPKSIGRGRKGVGTKIHVARSPEKIHGACLSSSNQVDMNEFNALWQQVIDEEFSILLLIKGTIVAR